MNFLDCVANNYPNVMAQQQMNSAVESEISRKLNRKSAESVIWLEECKKVQDEIKEEIMINCKC